jgi:hypothetical protein
MAKGGTAFQPDQLQALCCVPVAAFLCGCSLRFLKLSDLFRDCLFFAPHLFAQSGIETPYAAPKRNGEITGYHY